MELLSEIMKWVVAPVAAFVWMTHRKVNDHETRIAVQQSEIISLREAHGREIKEIKHTMHRIFEKLDSIEQSLRK